MAGNPKQQLLITLEDTSKDGWLKTACSKSQDAVRNLEPNNPNVNAATLHVYKPSNQNTA